MNEGPKRIQRSRAKNWKMPPSAIYVGRPTVWGNPFGHDGSDHSKRRCAQLYRGLMTGSVNRFIETHHPTRDFTLGDVILAQKLEAIRKKILSDVGKLRGHDLACWCPVGQPCHADVLLELANKPES
jgi:Domain of unknown function (DUF4326)